MDFQGHVKPCMQVLGRSSSRIMFVHGASSQERETFIGEHLIPRATDPSVRANCYLSSGVQMATDRTPLEALADQTFAFLAKGYAFTDAFNETHVLGFSKILDLCDWSKETFRNLAHTTCGTHLVEALGSMTQELPHTYLATMSITDALLEPSNRRDLIGCLQFMEFFVSRPFDAKLIVAADSDIALALAPELVDTRGRIAFACYFLS